MINGFLRKCQKISMGQQKSIEQMMLKATEYQEGNLNLDLYSIHKK